MSKDQAKNLQQQRFRWKRRDRIMLLEHLEMYASAGLTIYTAISAVATGMKGKRCEAVLQMQDMVGRGNSLSKSIAACIGLSPSLVGLLEQGESTGSISAALGLAKGLLEREDALLKTCLSALTYPIVIGLFAIILTIGLMRGVMPQIIPLLKSLHVALPLVTRIVIACSENVTSYGLYGSLAALVIGSVAYAAYARIALVKRAVHQILLRLPVVGSLMRSYALSLIARSLGALITSGAGESTSYDAVVERVALIPLRMAFERRSEDISRGITLGAVLSSMHHIPTYMPPLIMAGEASGSLGQALARAADILDRDIEHSLKRLTALVEPVMMAGMGCAVGAIALSIMMPIYDVSKALQH